MNRYANRVVLGVLAGIVLCWLSAPFWGADRDSAAALIPTETGFDAERAYQATREFVTRNPKRVLGSLESRQATGYLQQTLEELGYQVGFTHFDAMIAGRSQAGRNVLGFKAGPVPGILVVTAHYDTARTTFQGATDDGAGVGVMLELARVFADSPLRHSLLVLAADGEEWGMLGAADVAYNYPQRRQIAAVLSLDGVGPGDLAGLELNAEGQGMGFAPSWLRRLALRAAEKPGLPVAAAYGFREVIQRAIALPSSDQGPFLQAGIPAINLGSLPADPALADAIYHSANDTIDNLKPASVQAYGAAAERILRSLDSLDAMPRNEPGAFRWRGDAFVAASAMTVLLALAFAPFLTVLALRWSRLPAPLRVEAIAREIAFFVSWLAPFALLFSLIQLMRLMRLFPHYSMYPGPAGDPVLAGPPWGILAAIAGIPLGIGAGLHFLVRYLTRGLQRSFRSSAVVLQALMLVAAGLAFAYNPYWAAGFLALPALVWSWVGRGNSAGTRIAGAAAIAAAAGVFYAVALHVINRLDAGWNILWYAALGWSTGILPWQSFFLAASVFILGLRFFLLGFSRIPE